MLIDDSIIAEQLSALANPVRLTILRRLALQEKCQCKDVVEVLPLAQSTVSQHLKILCQAGLIDVVHKRPSSHYALNRKALSNLGDTFGFFVETCCDKTCCKSENSAEL